MSYDYSQTRSPLWERKPTPEQALERMKKGNQTFVTGESRHPHTSPGRLELARRSDQGEHAFATVLTCSDSRVPVELIFDAGVMDLFIVRVVGNVVGRAVAGSIEYGLGHVHTPLLVVLGHTGCGAVTAAVDDFSGIGSTVECNIPPLLERIRPAVERTGACNPSLGGRDLVGPAIEENVWQALHDLFVMSPACRQLAAAGRVMARGAVYEVGSGKVAWLSRERSVGLLAEVRGDPERVTALMAD